MKIKNIVFQIIFLLLFLVSIGSSIYIFTKLDGYSPYNKARVLVSSDLKLIEEEKYEQVEQSYYYCDLSGKIVYSDISWLSAGDILNLQEELQIDHAFLYSQDKKLKLIFPIYDEDKVTKGFAIFLIDKEKLEEQSLWIKAIKVLIPMILWGVLVSAYIFIRELRLKKYMFKPMKEIAQSADAIIQGNYEKEIIQKVRGRMIEDEIDNLSYSFELMRDELKHKAQREEDLNKIQRELMSCISHDLRTPITTIKAHAEALRDGLATDEEKRDRYVNTIINKTDILTKMIKNLLEQFNAELNQLAIVRKEIYADEYFFSIEKELEIYCKHDQASFHMENQLPKILITIDRDRINQVIYNIIENAIKYNDKEAKEIQLKTWYDNENRRVYVSVRDNGLGIQMTDIPYVFHAFYRAEKSRSIQIPGSGLGLSICKHIVEAHEGEIEVKSKTNLGSEFIFYLV